MILMLMLTCLTTFASDIGAVKARVGVSQMIPIKFPILKNSKHNFLFSSDDYNFRLVNKLVTRDVEVAVLPPEYALKAIWGRDDLDIVGKTSKHFIYLVSSEKNKSFTRESLKNKKVFILENSADEFYFKKYLNGVQYQRVSGTALELVNLVNKKNDADFFLFDSSNFFLLKKRNPTVGALKIEAGVYYVMTSLRENERILDPLTRKIFKKNNLDYYDLTKADLAELKDLNNSMFKRNTSQESFEMLFMGLMQR